MHVRLDSGVDENHNELQDFCSQFSLKTKKKSSQLELLASLSLNHGYLCWDQQTKHVSNQQQPSECSTPQLLLITESAMTGQLMHIEKFLKGIAHNTRLQMKQKKKTCRMKLFMNFRTLKPVKQMQKKAPPYPAKKGASRSISSWYYWVLMYRKSKYGIKTMQKQFWKSKE